MECLITKLKDTVNDDSLYRFDEFRINFDTTEETDSGFFTLNVNSSGDLHIYSSDNSSITVNDSTHESGYNFVNGGYIINIQNKKYYYSIRDKYNITEIHGNTFFNGINNYKPNIIADLNQLKYCNKLSSIDTHHCYNITGNLEKMDLNQKPLTRIDVQYTSPTPSTGGGLKGDIKYLNGIKTLTRFYAIFCTNITGTPSSLADCINLDDLFINYSGISGDFSLTPPKVKFLLGDKGYQHFTWENERPSNYPVIALNNITMSNIDRMLINQAKCTKGFSEEDPANKKTINIYGNDKTSASDSAVSTLKGMGYTIKINDITL